MNEDLNSFRYSRIVNYDYSHWFQEVQYNGKTLTESERQDYISEIDSTIDQYSEGLPFLHDELKKHKEQDGELHRYLETIYSVSLFVTVTMDDIMVVSKYFMLAKKDYERRLFQGKLSVILNEGFKRLYGFGKTHNGSEWGRLAPLMKYYSEGIKHQYQELTSLLDNQVSSSTWWKKERDCETHQDAEEMYISRQEEIIESKVMIDSMKLFEALLAVNHFLSNMHGCWRNYLLDKYRRGELKED